MHTNTHIHISGDRFEFPRGLQVLSSVYELVHLAPARGHLLLELPDERDIPLGPTDSIIINGKERFSVSLSPYPADDNPHLRKPLRPVMNEHPIAEQHALTHAKVSFLQMSQLDPHFEVGDGVFVEMTDIPDPQLTEGIRLIVQADDRFYTSPCGNVGYEERLGKDVAEARECYGSIDVIPESGRSLVVLRDQPLPSHWNRATSDILIQVPQGYPQAALDMFWVPPGLRLHDGRMGANTEVIEALNGTQWQRFSWHYAPTHKWNPSTDGLMSHMRFVRVRLAQAD